MVLVRHLLLWMLAMFAFAPAAVRAGDRAEAKPHFAAAQKDVARADFKAARTAIVEAVRADPQWGQANILQARILAELGDAAGAMAAVDRARKSGVPAPQLRPVLAHALMAKGDAQAALGEVSRSDIPPPLQPYAVRVRALAFRALGNVMGAARDYEWLVANTPGDSLIWSDMARFRQETGDQGGAIAAGQQAIKLNPRNHAALILLAQMSRSQYGLVAAIPWYERALAIEPGDVTTMLDLAATYGDAGRAHDMLAMTRRVFALDERNPRAYYLQAVLAARAGKYDLSRNLLNRTGDELDDLPAVALLKAVLEIRAGNEELAIARLRELMEKQPDNLKVRRLLGATMWRAGDAYGAVDMLKPIADRADADSYTLTIIGRAYEKLDDRNNAAVYLDRAAFPAPMDPVPFGSVKDLALVERANADDPNNARTAVPLISRLILAGRAGEALPVATRLRSQNPGVPAAWVLEGDALLALGRVAEAAKAYRAAANLEFSESNALRLIEALRRTGDEAQALKVLALFLEQNPRNLPAQRLLGDHYLAAGDWDRAIKVFESIRHRLGNRDASLLNALAWGWLGKGDQERALIFAKAAYDLSPTNPATVSTYGWFLVKSRQDAKTGILLLEKSVATRPDHAGLRYQLAEGYAATGRKDKAKEAVLRALQTPGFANEDKARKLLATL